MTSLVRPFSLNTRLALTLVAGAAGALLMTGCGIGTSAVSPSTVSPLVAGFGGKLMGGPNPIAGATVTLYRTGNNGASVGYGIGEFVQEAKQVGPNQGLDTAADGSFSFAGGYSCPAGQFLYIQSIGGNTGAGYNPKALLVAALGRCEDLFSGGQYVGGYIYLNEVTTVAAAYALGHFTNINGIGSSTIITMGAPPANNASVGCVADGGTCASTATAGLRHAFQNATNLVSPFTGLANTKLPGNSDASVPAQLINSIANALVTCVNSDGSSTACQTIFGATGTNFQNGTIFQVALNLAKNPTLAGTGYTTAQFYAATTPQTLFYRPMLTAAPTDYSIAINIPKQSLKNFSGGVQGLLYPVSGTLDINDNYYVGNYESAAQTVSNAISFKSDVTLVSFTTDNSTSPTANGASVDKLGHLFLVGSTTGQDGALSKYSINTTTAAIAPGPTVVPFGGVPLTSSAVDAKNNLWFGTYDGTINELPAGTTTPTYSHTTPATVAAVAVDVNQNIWLTSYATGASNSISAIPNSGTVANPSYQGFVTRFDSAGDYASGISFGAGTNYDVFVANMSNSPAIAAFSPTLSGPTVTAISPDFAVYGGLTAPSNNQTDGTGTVWVGDGTNLVQYTPGQSAVTTLLPCTVSSTSNTTCATNPYTGMQSVSIDSAGSVWFLSSSSGSISQLIGGAAPTWPLLPLAKFGTTPQ